MQEAGIVGTIPKMEGGAFVTCLGQKLEGLNCELYSHGGLLSPSLLRLDPFQLIVISPPSPCRRA
jgi:hypothetical protein